MSMSAALASAMTPASKNRRMTEDVDWKDEIRTEAQHARVDPQ
jgi:hypothetical protein